ncbi:hypothetical protein [Paenibacillus riograndensis]|uniref:Putative membrane protein n=1 Tax=Paenibacillus riograndensis SBR5 TaxID=1073571 RepID=A0A0E4CUD0_9BACL|nr:hypothetical protein [Paenibacillus riograndensis]CQR51842.1 putative membrane protein [Paenibacillus riograndensis SBR5]
MHKSQHTAEEQNLRSYDASGDAKAIDVRQRVMNIITEKYGNVKADAVPPGAGESSEVMQRIEESPARAVRKRLIFHSRTLAVSVSLLAVLFLGSTYYWYADIHNQTADIPYTVKDYEEIEDPVTQFRIQLKETPVQPGVVQPEEDVKTRKYQEAKKWVEQQLLPGETGVFLVGKDLSANPSTGSAVNPLHYDSYSDFRVKSTEQEDPVLPEPEYVPKGYAFSGGEIIPETDIALLLANPSKTTSGDKSESGVEAYLRLKEEMSVMKAIDLGEGYKLVWKRFHAAGASSVKVSYTTTEGQSINIQATDLLRLGTAQFNTYGMEKYENVVVAGKEMIYMKPLAEGGHKYTQRLVWLDSVQGQGAYYSLSDSKDSPLSRQELINVAASMLHSKK